MSPLHVELAAIFALMDEADSALDKETYDDWRRGEFDLPDDCELVITVKTDRKINKVFEALNALRQKIERSRARLPQRVVMTAEDLALPVGGKVMT